MTYLRLVPVASRRAAGASGDAVGQLDGACLEPAVGSRGIGEIVVEADDPTGRFRAPECHRAGSAAARAASDSGGGAGDVERRLEASPSRPASPGRGPAGALPAAAIRSPSARQPAIADERVDDGRRDGTRRPPPKA